MNFKYTEEITGKIVQIPVEMIRQHPHNPRKELGDLSELAESIKAKGILQNLTVVCNEPGAGQGYTAIIGHRRLAAAKLAGLETVPCIIARMTPAEQVQTMLLENIQRSDLTAYEQAQGFQMMIDFGDTVETVAEKTGFSKTTIRRRLEMAKLDEKVLKSVSDRQLSLSDFDKLSKLDDMKERNRLLEYIGTNNFNSSVEYAIKKQEIQKRLPAIKKRIKELKGTKIQYSQTYSGKYERIGHEIDISKWDGKEISASVEGKLFYCLDENRGTLGFYQEKKQKPVKRSKKRNRERKSGAGRGRKAENGGCYPS